MAKSALLTSLAGLPAASRAVTRTRACWLTTLGTLHPHVPELPRPSASGLQLPPLSTEYSRSTLVTPTLSDADHVTLVAPPADSVSPPLGESTMALGAIASAAPEFVNASAMPGAMTESTPPG